MMDHSENAGKNWLKIWGEKKTNLCIIPFPEINKDEFNNNSCFVYSRARFDAKHVTRIN